MDIIGNGVDIIKNSRINNSLKIKGFLKRIFTEKEIQQGKKLKIPTYKEKKIPETLKKIPITKPGSRFIK